MSSRGTIEESKSYTTSITTIMEFDCPHTSKRGVVFYVFATTAGTATISYIQKDGTARELSTVSCAASDLTTIPFNFPISRVRLSYTGTSSGGTVYAEGRGH